jgi:hypothetical protein
VFLSRRDKELKINHPHIKIEKNFIDGVKKEGLE